MSATQLLLLILIVAVSAFFHGLSGFGIGILLMFFLPMIVDFSTAVIICLICALVMGCIMLTRLLKYIQLKKILPMMISGIVVQTICTAFLFELDSITLRLILGIIMLAFAGLFVLSYKKWQIKESLPNSFGFGIIGGVCGALGVGGPPTGYYCHSIFKDNLAYLANVQVCIMLPSIFLLVQHAIRGNITGIVLGQSAIGAVVCVLVLFPTMRLFRKLDRSKLTTVIIGMLLVMGLVSIIVPRLMV